MAQSSANEDRYCKSSEDHDAHSSISGPPTLKRGVEWGWDHQYTVQLVGPFLGRRSDVVEEEWTTKMREVLRERLLPYCEDEVGCFTAAFVAEQVV